MASQGDGFEDWQRHYQREMARQRAQSDAFLHGTMLYVAMPCAAFLALRWWLYGWPW